MTVNGQVWSFAYTGGGERVVKANAPLHHRTLSADGLYIRHDRMGAVEHRCRVFLSGGGVVERVFTKPAAAAPLSSETYYLHLDNVMNVRAVSDLAGVVQRRAYEPFGRRVDPKNMSNPVLPSAGTTMGFAGHDHDDELSLINMKGRLYDPELAGFLTPDPVIKDMRLSSSYNPYSYSFNNPQTWRDPTGFDAESQAPPAPPSTEAAGTASNSGSTSGSPANVPGTSDNGVDPTAASSTTTSTTCIISTATAPNPSGTAPISETVISCLTGTVTQVEASPVGLTLTPSPAAVPPSADGLAPVGTAVGETGNALTVTGGIGNFLELEFWLRYTGKLTPVGPNAAALIIERGAPSMSRLGKLLQLGRAVSKIRIGPFSIGGIGSVLGIGSAVISYGTGRTRADRVQAVADGLFSASGLCQRSTFTASR